MIITDLFFAGFYALSEYLSAHVLTCLIPAFFIAGAIAVFLKKDSVLKYLGPKTKKHISYSVAAVSGCLLAVCSCTILPLFAGIKKRGAGLGPAITFLFSGPAINLLAIIYTARVLGFDIGMARAVAAIFLSIIIGLIMHFLFRKKEMENEDMFLNLKAEQHLSKTTISLFFALLIGLLIVNGFQIAFELKILLFGVLIGLLLVLLKLKFTKKDEMEWMRETWNITKLITPYLLIGVFIAGIISFLLPGEIVRTYLGGNSLTSNFVASIFGAFMYFATLTEVPIIGELMRMGMGKGPALALLLAGPSLSLPSLLVIRKILGNKQTIVYIILVVFFSTIVGMIFGSI
ncbi:MAG: permease [Candidatus Aenigmarchaeota archaeon]|nr:permease [Candidatus Aenigmarchaeota archaeon]